MTLICDRGDRVEITTGTPFKDSAGTAFDPDVVRFRVRNPAGTVTTYVYGTDSEVTRTTTGDYKLTIDVDSSGNWYCRVEGETSAGENRGADEIYFTVKSSKII